MRIGLLSFNQSVNDHPLRYISTRDAKLGVLRGTHRKISKKLFQEIRPAVTASSNPQRHSIPKLNVVHVSDTVITSVSCTISSSTYLQVPSTLNLFYPVRDQSTYAQRNFLEVWGCDLEDWKRRIGANT